MQGWARRVFVNTLVLASGAVIPLAANAGQSSAVRFAGAAKAPDARMMLAYGVPGMQVNPINLILKRPQ